MYHWQPSGETPAKEEPEFAPIPAPGQPAQNSCSHGQSIWGEAELSFVSLKPACLTLFLQLAILEDYADPFDVQETGEGPAGASEAPVKLP